MVKCNNKWPVSWHRAVWPLQGNRPNQSCHCPFYPTPGGTKNHQRLQAFLFGHWFPFCAVCRSFLHPFYSSLSLIPSTVIDSILFYSLRFHSIPRRFIPFIQSYMLVFNHSFSIDGLMAGWIDWFIDSLMNQLVGWFIDPLIRWFVQQVLLLTSSKANAQWSDVNGVLKGCIKIVLFVVLSVILASKW